MLHLFLLLLGALKNLISSDSTYDELASKDLIDVFFLFLFWTTLNLTELLAFNRLLVPDTSSEYMVVT